MGTVIIVAWLLGVVAVVFALIRRFDPDARNPDTGPGAVQANSHGRPISIDKNAPSGTLENGGAA